MTPPVEEVKRYVLGWQQGNGPFDEPMPAMVARNWSPGVTSYVRSAAYDAKCAEVERLAKAHAVTEREACSRAEDAERYRATIATLTERVSELAARVQELEAVVERCAVTAWNTGMDMFITEHPKQHDAREVGASCAAAIRATIIAAKGAGK